MYPSSTPPFPQSIEALFTILAVCHTVVTTTRVGDPADEANWTPDNVVYQAARGPASRWSRCPSVGL